MIILASASPRRAELLRLITHDFKIVPADIDENLPKEFKVSGREREAAEFLAVQKCISVANRYPSDTIIGCDTIVVADGQILGKPVDEEDARRMLLKLSGRSHCVCTGVCISESKTMISFYTDTMVTFYDIPPAAIDEYIKTGSPLDKAGAYGIQDDCIRLFTERIDGSFDSVMGLPVAKINRMLGKLRTANYITVSGNGA